MRLFEVFHYFFYDRELLKLFILANFISLFHEIKSMRGVLLRELFPCRTVIIASNDY